MKRRTLWLLISLFMFIAAAFLLISGSSLLLISLSEAPYIPLGNLITWLGIISLPLTLYFASRGLREPKAKGEKLMAMFLKISMLLALLWVPVCYLLAGNFSFSFTEKPGFQGGQLAMRIFWYYSYTTAAAPVLLGLIYGGYSLFRKKSRRSS